jgi:hypothetical protein
LKSVHIEMSSVLVEEHHRRLREAAQDPAPRLAQRIWSLLGRRRLANPVVTLPDRDVERLAA